MADKKILIIENDKEYQRLLASVCKDHQVKIVSGGEQGISLLKEFSPDLIILAVEITDTNGYIICRRIKQDEATSKIPILITSKAPNSEEVFKQHKELKTRADAYRKKPYNEKTIKPIIERLLGVEEFVEVPSIEQLDKEILEGDISKNIEFEKEDTGEVKERSFAKVELVEDDEIKDIKDRLAKIEDELQVRAQTDDLGNRIDNVVQKLKMDRVEKDTKIKKLEDILAEGEKKAEKAELLKDKISEKEKEIKDGETKRKADLAVLRDYYKPKLEKLAKLEEQIKKFSLQMKVYKKDQDNLKTELGEMKKENKKLSDKNEKLKKIKEQLDQIL